MARRQWLADEDLDRMHGRWKFLIDLIDPGIALQRIEIEMRKRGTQNSFATPSTVAKNLKLRLGDVNRIIETCQMYGTHMRGRWFFPLRAFAVVLCDILFIHLDWRNREVLRELERNKPRRHAKEE